MAQVPTYTPSVAERPAFQQAITVRAQPNDFGAQIGAGLQNVGQGLKSAADAFDQLQQLEDIAKAKERDNQFAAWDREAKYGENGFLTLSGQAAIDGRKGYETALAAKRSEFGQGLSPGAAQAYGTASTARVNSSLETAIIHTSTERKKWLNDTSNARLDTFKEDAQAVWNRPNEVTKQIALGQAELRSQADLFGWSADVLKNQEVQYISDVRKSIVERMAIDDPIAAQAYFDLHKKELTGEHQAVLAEKLQIPVANAAGLSAAATFMGTTTRDTGRANAGEGPTNARAFLTERLVTKGRTADIEGLDGSFVNNLTAMFEDAPDGMREGLGILSGARSNERQQVLWDAALKKYGSPEAARKWVAPPGHSRHNSGQAVDLSYNGQSLKHAPPDVIKWVHDNAAKYGMTFPMDWENWHIEPAGARSGSTAVAATGVTVPRASAPSWTQMETYLATISDPRARTVARSAITSQIEAQAKDATASRKSVEETAFNQMISQNMSPYTFTPDVQSMIGREGMNNLMSYWDKQASGEKIQTNPNLLYQLQLAHANDPETFSKIDMMQYVTQLSEEDRKTATGWQASDLTNQRTDRESGKAIKGIMDQATTSLDAAGITLTGLGANDLQKRQEMAQRIAEINVALAHDLEAFKRDNAGKTPTYEERQHMIDTRMLPIATKNWHGGYDDNGLKMFDLASMPENTTYQVAVKITDIPADVRIRLINDLTDTLNRPPTEDEVTTEYETLFMGGLDNQGIADRSDKTRADYNALLNSPDYRLAETVRPRK